MRAVLEQVGIQYSVIHVNTVQLLLSMQHTCTTTIVQTADMAQQCAILSKVKMLLNHPLIASKWRLRIALSLCPHGEGGVVMFK